jgi:hypothetical protein
MRSQDLIRATGEALFGERWETALADLLHVNRRTVRRWKTGENEPSKGVWQELCSTAMQREGELTRVRIELARKAED